MKLPNYANSDIKVIIDEFLHSERDREIAYARLVNGISIEECAEKWNRSPRQMQRIVNRIQTEVFIHYVCPENDM